MKNVNAQVFQATDCT